MQISLARLRDEHPAPEEFVIEEYSLVAELDGDRDQLVWVRTIQERVAVVERTPKGDRELINLRRLTIPKERIPRSYTPTHDPVTGIKIVASEEGRARGRETQRRMRAATKAAQGEGRTRPQVRAAACG